MCCDDAVAGRPRWPLTTLNPPSLRRFKQKFGPEWHDRYLVAPGLPRPIALLAVVWAHIRSPIRVRSPR